jgi:glycosyltransferase involved in cell wall biosynthesis
MAVNGVDILLPYYGVVELLQDTVRSALGQTDDRWRLTVVDDCYPDLQAKEWLISLHDDRIRYFRNDINLGLNRNFQCCLQLAELDALTIIGGDDILLPNYVHTVLDAYERVPGVDIVQPGVAVVDAVGRPARNMVDVAKKWIYAPPARETVLGGQPLAASLLRGNWLYFPSLCWRTQAAKVVGFREDLDVVLDLALVLDLIERGSSLLVVPQKCFQYRRHRASASSWRALDGSRFTEERRFFLETADRLEQRGWNRAARIARRHLSSRLNALWLVAFAVRGRQFDAVRPLARYVLGADIERPTDG